MVIDASLADLMCLAMTVDNDSNNYAWSATIRLAERFSLSMYDATYLELAERLRLPLATLDDELRAAAPALGMAVVGNV